jgi:hypothetical protein
MNLDQALTDRRQELQAKIGLTTKPEVQKKLKNTILIRCQVLCNTVAALHSVKPETVLLTLLKKSDPLHLLITN